MSERKVAVNKRPDCTDEQRFKEALKVYRPKIHTFAVNSVHSFAGVGVEDLEQEILMVLWKCLQTYDPNKAAGFSTYFWTTAKNKMVDLIKGMNRIKRQTEWFIMSDDATLARLINGVIEDSSAEDWAVIHETVLERWNDLPERERRRLRVVS